MSRRSHTIFQMDESEKLQLAERILVFCHKFNVPLEFLFEILEDQKVTPMIRGKAMEFGAFRLLDSALARSAWSVQKLNLNAQQGVYDEDITITHRRTGVILKVESKSSVRGSFSDGTRSRTMKRPHFHVKCHRSRSNISLAGTSNDRYSVDSFDVVVTNTSNAIFQGNTVGEELEVVHDERLRAILLNHYNAQTLHELIDACYRDWRFAIPSDIGVDGFIPRTPIVALEDDPFWRPISEIEERITQVVDAKRSTKHSSRRN